MMDWTGGLDGTKTGDTDFPSQTLARIVTKKMT